MCACVCVCACPSNPHSLTPPPPHAHPSPPQPPTHPTHIPLLCSTRSSTPTAGAAPPPTAGRSTAATPTPSTWRRRCGGGGAGRAWERSDVPALPSAAQHAPARARAHALCLSINHTRTSDPPAPMLAPRCAASAAGASLTWAASRRTAPPPRRAPPPPSRSTCSRTMQRVRGVRACVHACVCVCRVKRAWGSSCVSDCWGADGLSAACTCPQPRPHTPTLSAPPPYPPTPAGRRKGARGCRRSGWRGDACAVGAVGAAAGAAGGGGRGGGRRGRKPAWEDGPGGGGQRGGGGGGGCMERGGRGSAIAAVTFALPPPNTHSLLPLVLPASLHPAAAPENLPACLPARPYCDCV